jgi:hypothetical protein
LFYRSNGDTKSIRKLPPGSDVVSLRLSPTGNYLCVFWTDNRTFSLHETKTWSVVDGGPAHDFAWASLREDVYATFLNNTVSSSERVLSIKQIVVREEKHILVACGDFEFNNAFAIHSGPTISYTELCKFRIRFAR